MLSCQKRLDAQLLFCVSLIYFHTLYVYMNRVGWLVNKYQNVMGWLFSYLFREKGFTFVVIFRNKTGGSFQMDPTFVGSF